jgi:hypothetical protein
MGDKNGWSHETFFFRKGLNREQKPVYALWGRSPQLHKRLNECLIESLGLLEYDSCLFGQPIVRIAPSGDSWKSHQWVPEDFATRASTCGPCGLQLLKFPDAVGFHKGLFEVVSMASLARIRSILLLFTPKSK